MTEKTMATRRQITFILLIISIMTISCSFFYKNPLRQQRDPTSSDEGFEEFVLGFTGDTFSSETWKRNYSVDPDKMQIVWRNQEYGAIAVLNYQIIAGSSTTPEEYYSEENLRNIFFGDYENLQRIEKCSNPGENLILYKFRGDLHDTTYIIRFWEILKDRPYVMDLMIVFPHWHVSQMEAYAQELFPNLSNCDDRDI